MKTAGKEQFYSKCIEALFHEQSYSRKKKGSCKKKKIKFPHEDSYDAETRGRIPRAELVTAVTTEGMKILLSVQSLCKADGDQEEVKSKIKNEA